MSERPPLWPTAPVDLLATPASGLPTAFSAVPGRRPLVLLSGMLGDSHLWDGVAEELADVATPWPVRIDRDESVAEMALSVLAQAPARFALAGHSLGGIVALEVVRRAPARVSHLALVNTSARGASPAQQEAWGQWRAQTQDGGFEAVALALAHASVGTGVHEHRAQLVDAALRMAHTVGPAGFVRQLSAQATRPDSRASLASVGVPVLVVSGELDAVCPPELQREMSALCPGAQWQSVAGAGHLTPLEAPAELAAVLRAWLTGRPRSDAAVQ